MPANIRAAICNIDVSSHYGCLCVGTGMVKLEAMAAAQVGNSVVR